MKTLKRFQQNLEDLQIPIILSDLFLESIDNTLIVLNCKAEKEPIGKNQRELEPKHQ